MLGPVGADTQAPSSSSAATGSSQREGVVMIWRFKLVLSPTAAWAIRVASRPGTD